MDFLKSWISTNKLTNCDMNPNSPEYIRSMRHPIKFRLFLLSKLPSAYLSGVRIREIDEKRCVVTVPYKWLSQNPFKSTYFACLSMAAEMSTGALAMVHIYKRKPAISMLVVKMEAEYFKKATGRTAFTCDEGEALLQTIEDSIASGEGRTFRARSTGRNANNETVAEFYITWSFKARRQ